MWYAVYVTATGELVSIGTVLADPLPGHLSYKSYIQRPDTEANIWSTTILDFVTRPPAPELPVYTEALTLISKSADAWSNRDVAKALQIILAFVVQNSK